MSVVFFFGADGGEWDAGATISRASGWTRLPESMDAAIPRSSSLPFVHVPMTPCWMGVPSSSGSGATLST